MFDKRLMELCPESRRYIAGNIVFQWLKMLMNVVMMYCISGLFEYYYYDRGGGLERMWSAIGIILLTLVFRYVLNTQAVRMSHLASRSVMGKMRELIYDKLLVFGSGYSEKVSTAEIVQESVEGVEQLESYFGQYVPQFFYALIAPVTLFFVFGFAGSWATGGVLLICVPLIPGTIMMVQKFAKKLLAKYWGQYTQLGSTFLENLQGMTTLKTYQADEFKNIEMNRESENFRVITMKVLTMQLNSIIIMDFFTYGGAALGIILATRAFRDYAVSLGTCLFMILLSVEFFLPMRQLGSYFHVAMNGMAASDRIFSFLSEEEPPVKKETLDEDFRDIQIRDLSFSYDGNSDVLRNIDMDIPKGSFTGIVGESGSGKSTIASLLMGRNTCRSGSILINGKRLDEIKESELMATITYVGHDSLLFKGTVRDNLMIADRNADEKKMNEVLERCRLADFLKQENGLDTRLEEAAANLSGGQRQRLALARAILHDTPVYIFDEATSNIDMESEEFINRSIAELRKTKTVIMISHRLANVTDADVIYVLEDGAVKEKGRHEELLKNRGTYAGLYETQKKLEMYGKEGM